MIDDIVTRLEQEHWCDADDCNLAQLAADEIERLRNQVRQLETERDQWIRQAIGRD